MVALKRSILANFRKTKESAAHVLALVAEAVDILGHDNETVVMNGVCFP